MGQKMRKVFGVLGAGLLSAALSLPASSAEPPVPQLKPPAPVSPFIAAKDEALLKSVFGAIKRRSYDLANVQRSQLSDPIVRSIADWAFLRERSTIISTREIEAFLDSHHGWPNTSLIQEKAEKAFDDETPADEILAFFQNRDPRTGNGHLHLARAFLEKGNEDAARSQLKIAWIDYDWTRRQEQEILGRFGRLLTQADHWSKADRQLFNIHATSTLRLVPWLSPTKQKEARVRVAFLTLDRNAEALYKQLPQTSQLDSGVLHAATRYFRRTQREDQAIVYASLAPLDRGALRNPERWYTERKLLARWALKTGRFQDAYTLSAYSGLEGGGNFAEAEFTAGWVALRFLNDPERAKAHFAYLVSGVSAPISLARGEYWLARAWAASGDEEAAAQHYRVASAFPYTFYGQLAAEALGPGAVTASFPANLPDDEAARQVFEARPLVHAMRILSEIDEGWHYDRFARALDDQIQSRGEVAAYHDLVVGDRKMYLAVRAGKVARNNGAEVPAVVYPMVLVPQAAKVFTEEALILGLSRQESEFNPRAYSRARARGMMQLLDSTARITARKEHIPYSTGKLMSDPLYNLTLGAAHLNHLLERFQGSYIMVLAAYNAGPQRVDQWINTYGDPRDPSVDPIDWIELIPFSETRNYVMRVLENTQVYRARITGKPIAGRLTQDLVRGGSTPKSIGIYPPAPRLLNVSLEDGGGNNIWINTPTEPPKAVTSYPSLEFPPLADELVVPSE